MVQISIRPDRVLWKASRRPFGNHAGTSSSTPVTAAVTARGSTPSIPLTQRWLMPFRLD